MKKNIIVIMFSLIILSACTFDVQKTDASGFSAEELSFRIENLKEKITMLEEQVRTLTEVVEHPKQIFPVEMDNRLLYVNPSIQFAISIDNKDDLPLVVYGKEGSLSIYYITSDVTQFIEAYTIVPSVFTKENNVDPEFYDKKQIIKMLDENWVIVRIISIESSLDQTMNHKINDMLADIKFY